MAKKAAKKTGKKKATRRKKSGAEPMSRGIEAADLGSDDHSAEVDALADHVKSDGGSVLGIYRDPLGGKWQILAGLPIDLVEPTPFQRDLSATHVKRMTNVIDKLDRFLDPVIAVRTEDGKYWTPNGHHRLSAVRDLGGKSIVALVLPEFEVCYKILALNTEKAHNLKEKALEVIRMARALADLGDQNESNYGLEFEEPGFLTIGICYEERGRFSGSAYNPIVKRCEAFQDNPLSKTIEMREARAKLLLEVDDAVAAAVKTLKERGFDSPYLKAFVIARVNPIRFKKGGDPDFDETFEKMLDKAKAFDAGKIKEDQITASGGPAGGDD
jgi:ParB family chromosome partitioning protein